MAQETTILVIDDQKKILDIISHFLEDEGYHVLTEADPEDGLEVAFNNDIDLLMLDIMMPKMSGYEVYDELKEDDEMKQIPIIMLTARSVIESTPKDYFYGMYGVISKPFSRDELVTKIENILSMSAEEQ